MTTTRPPRIRVRAAALVLCGAAAIAAAVAASAPATAAGRSEQGVIAASAGVPVVIDCAAHPQVRPGQYILACADAGAYLTGLHWAAWGSSSAFAGGFFKLNLCTPDCSAGHFARFPMLAALWRAEPRPGHPGQRYFTRVTIIYTGNRAYREHGRLFHLPPTVTDPLSEFGGAGTP
jgi:hypothetical protein